MTSITPTPPDAAQLADPRVAKAWKAAQDFEAMTLGELLKPMFATVDLSNGPFGGGPGEAAWQPMLVDEFAKTMERNGGVGLAVPVFQQILRLQEAKGNKP
jgi:Rod binding domain-containing protein